MRGGQLDRRIEIQQPIETQDNSGESIQSWDTIASVWAQKIENRGQERFTAQQLSGRAIRTFRFRWNSRTQEITVKHRIVFDGRSFNITDVREIGRRDGIEVDCWTDSEEPLKQ